MTEDQQAGTLAFLQNFYTGVTLYMPFEAEERAPAPALPARAEAPPVGAPAAQPASPPVAAVAAPAAPLVVPAAPPATPASVTSLAAQSAPVAAPATGPSRLPSLASVPPLPAAPVAAAASPGVPPVPASPPVTLAAVAPVAPPRPAGPVAPPAAATPSAPAAPYLRTTFNTLGTNQQGVVILVRLPESQFVKLPRNVFLNKLLQALQLVMADVVLVNVDGPYPVALENLRREIAATQVLAFGRNLLDVAVRTTQIYEPVRFPNLNLAYLAAAEVEMVEYDVSLKKRLWVGLKAMFL